MATPIPIPKLKPRTLGFKFLTFGEATYGYEASLLLSAVAKGNPADRVHEVWDALGYPPAKFFTFPSSRDLPAAVMADAGTFIWVGVNGTDNLSQVIKYACPDAVYAREFGHIRNETYNAQFDLWGTEIVRRLRDYVGSRNPRVAFHGHSYGGAVVTIAAMKYAVPLPPHHVTCVTFGAPKIGDDKYMMPLDNVLLRRWMNEGDPIPCLPPTEGELGVPVPAFRKLVLKFLLPPYKSPPGGFILLPDGTIYPGSHVRLTPSLTDLIWLDDRADFDPRRFARHKLVNYTATLEKAAVLDWLTFGVDFRVTVKPGTPVKLVPLPKPLVALLRRYEADRALHEVLSKLEKQQVINPTVSPYVPKSYRAKTQRHGSDWCCNWCGIVVCIDPSRSKCHTLEKAINKLARRMIITVAVQGESFKAAWDAFVAGATVGGIGFRPDIADIQPF